MNAKRKINGEWEEFWRIICSKPLLPIDEKGIEEIVQKETGYLPESIKIGNETISLYMSKSQFFDLVNQERIGRGSNTLFILKYLCRTNAKGWYALSCKGMKRGMKDYPTKKLIENYVKMECEYKEAQIPLFATWKFKDSNNQSEYTFMFVNDPNLARGLIQISGCISLKKIRYCTLL